MTDAQAGLTCLVTGVAELVQPSPDGTEGTTFAPGEQMVVSDPAMLAFYVQGGHVRILGADGEPIPELDEVVMIAFAIAGVPFIPADWSTPAAAAPTPAPDPVVAPEPVPVADAPSPPPLAPETPTETPAEAPPAEAGA